MKKLLALMLALVLTGCAAQSAPEQEETDAAPGQAVAVEEADLWGITLAAKDVTPGGLTIVCSQSGGGFTGELSTGNPYWLEVEEDGVWQTYPAKQEEIVWTMEGWMIPFGGQVEWATNWLGLYGTLPAGHYRIGKKIIDWRAPGDYDERPCYAEFTIE